MSVAKTILKRLFRVYAHIYHQHFDSVMQLQEEAHLNTSFKHFIFFVQVRAGGQRELGGWSVLRARSCWGEAGLQVGKVEWPEGMVGSLLGSRWPDRCGQGGHKGGKEAAGKHSVS